MKDLLEEAGQSWREMEAGRGFPSVWRAGPVLGRPTERAEQYASMDSWFWSLTGCLHPGSLQS